MHIIKYTKPAVFWHEALPLGNGLTGVMVYGSLKREQFCFNDGTLWSGYPKDYNSKESLDNLNRVRNLIFVGENAEADTLCEEKLTGFYSESFMPLGKVVLKFGGICKSGYSRTLDLSNALHSVKTKGCTAETFCSYPDKITIYRIKAEKPFSVRIKAKSNLKSDVYTEENNLFLMGNAPDYAAPSYLKKESNSIDYSEKKGMAFCLQTQVQTDGSMRRNKNNITVKKATEMTLYFVSATGFNGFDKMPETDRSKVKQKCEAVLNRVNKDYEFLKKRHIDDFSSLYNNQSISKCN